MDQIEKSFRKRYVLGICALDKKAHSPPMQSILTNLKAYGDCEIVYFGDDLIHNYPVEKWPLCDCIIAFFSKGYPLEKAIDYVKLRRPFCINDLEPQKLLWDRRAVLKRLAQYQIPTAKHLIVNREQGALWNNQQSFVENEEEEYIEVIDNDNGEKKRMYKPFVEKPYDGENHNVYIYYSRKQGGGCRKLFRKIGNKSSEFFPEVNRVRRDSSYVYEEFIEVENSQDVKIYAVGKNFCHAECRKSPVVDGVVQRKPDGKEMRFQTQLSEEETEMASKVVHAFNQVVCGFDVLRLKNGKSLVCDVNGWSFVKGSTFYYEKCAEILRVIFTDFMSARPLDGRVARHYLKQYPLVSDLATNPHFKLEGSVVVCRHADRTPKQKKKYTISHPKLRKLFPEDTSQEYEFRSKEQLRHLLEVITDIAEGNDEDDASANETLEVKRVLENIIDDEGTKVQLRYQTDVLQINETDTKVIKIPQMVCKWGGEITHVGLEQAKSLGKRYRDYVLPMLDEDHLTTENVIVCSSGETRNRRSAIEFARSMLGMDSLQEDFVIVNTQTKKLLDDSNNARTSMDKVKAELHLLMSGAHGFGDSAEKSNEDRHTLELYRRCGVEQVHISKQKMHELYEKMNAWIKSVEKEFRDEASTKLFCKETVEMILNRSKKLLKSFHNPKKQPPRFDISKISDIYDNLMYDLIHHSELFGKLGKQVFDLAQHLAAITVPNEYGIMAFDRINIGMKVSGPLINRICYDLRKASKSTNFKSCFYVTNETHCHALKNILCLTHLGRLCDVDVTQLDGINYCATFVFEVFKNINPRSPHFGSLYVRIKFSSGASSDAFLAGLVDKNRRDANSVGEKNENHYIQPIQDEPLPILYPGVPIELLEATTKYWIEEDEIKDWV